MFLQGLSQAETTLFQASKAGDLDAVRSVVSSVKSVNALGRTALFYASSVEIANELIKHGASVDFVDFTGCSALRVAIEDGLLDVFEVLLTSLVDAGLVFDFASLLDFACEVGEARAVRMLLHTRADAAMLDTANRQGLTPLLTAAKFGHLNIVEMLIDRCDVGVCDSQKGRNVLHLAVIGKHADLVAFLLGMEDEEMIGGRDVEDKIASEYADQEICVLFERNKRKDAEDSGGTMKRDEDKEEEKGKEKNAGALRVVLFEDEVSDVMVGASTVASELETKANAFLQISGSRFEFVSSSLSCVHIPARSNGKSNNSVPPESGRIRRTMSVVVKIV